MLMDRDGVTSDKLEIFCLRYSLFSSQKTFFNTTTRIRIVIL